MSASLVLLSVVVALTAIVLTVIAAGTFWWSLYAWRSPGQL